MLIHYIYLRNKVFFPMITGIALRDSKKAYLAKLYFMTHWIIMQLVIKKYEHVLNVWKAFNMNNMKVCHDL